MAFSYSLTRCFFAYFFPVKASKTEDKEVASDKIHPHEAFDLETQIGRAAKVSIECYQNAINVVRGTCSRFLRWFVHSRHMT